MKLTHLAFGALLLTSLIGCGGGGGNGSGGSINNGRIYVSDTSHHRIVRMDNIQGDNWTSFGTNGSGVNQFSYPSGMAFDAQGRLYIVDRGNERIVRMDDWNGTNWTTYGGSGSGVGKFSNPSKITIDAQGRIYVADSGNHRIVRIDDMAGANWVAYGSLGTGPGKFNSPFGIAVDSDFRIYVCDGFNPRIVRIDSMAGAGWTEFTDPQLDAPSDIKLYGNKMLIADRNKGVILTGLMSANGWKKFYLENAQSCSLGAGGKVFTIDQSLQLLSQYPSMDGGSPITYGSVGQNGFDNPNYLLLGP